MKRPPFWQNFQVIAWVVGGLTALGTVIVVANRYIELPAKVEAAEQEIEDLKGWAKEIQGYTRAMQQQMSNQAYPTQPADRPGKFWDEQAQRWYCDNGWTTWWVDSEGNC